MRRRINQSFRPGQPPRYLGGDIIEGISRLDGAVEGGTGRRGGFVIFDEAGGGRGVGDEGGPRAGHAGGALQAVDEVGNGSGANEVVLPSFESAVGMLFMMAYHSNADAAGDFPEEEMIWKAPQIDPSPISLLEMESLRMGSSLVDERVQLLPELIAQAVVDPVVVAQNS